MFEESCLSPQLPYIAINRMRYAGNLEQVRTSIVSKQHAVLRHLYSCKNDQHWGQERNQIWHQKYQVLHVSYDSFLVDIIGVFWHPDQQSLFSVKMYWVTTVAPIINSPCVHVYVYVSYYHIMLEMLLLKATRKQWERCGGPGESLQQMTVMSLK